VNYGPGECVVTTAISPNDDGYNDEMVISCLIDEGKYPNNKLIIYNQWGDQVYEAAPYKNNWKGTNDGKKLPDGTYFYIFQRDPSEPTQKGFVMIYR
jgi:gliding motility-associated-like protein